MRRKPYSNSFAGGHQSTLMLGHIEDEGYRTGFAFARNMLAMPTGPAMKRPPFVFCKAAKAGTTPRVFTFRYGDGDAYAMEWGPAHTRFHFDDQDGNPATLRYATPIPVASVDLNTETFTTVAAHGLVVNDQVRITHKGVNIPGNLATGTIYFVLTTPTSTTFTLSATMGGATLDLNTHSTIDETSFWKQAEPLPREYVQSRNVTRTGNQLDAAAAHGLVSTHGDGVHITTSGTLPAGLEAGRIYYHRFVDADSFRVATTKQAALAVAFTFTADPATDTMTAVAHGLVNGSTVETTTSGTLPATLIAATNYWIVNATADTFQLAATEGGAPIDIITAGVGVHTATPYVVLSSAGAGTHTFHYAYLRGDVVWGGSLTLLGTTSSRAFWCAADLTTALPTVADWHQMPADGTFELLHGLGAQGLATLNYAQSFDEWAFVTAAARSYQLVRSVRPHPSGISTNTDTIVWSFHEIEFVPDIGFPGLGFNRNFGEYHTITFGDGAPVATNIAQVASVAATSSGAPIVAGDTVYMEKTLGAADAIPGIAGTPGFFIVAHVGQLGGTGTTQDLRFRSVLGGAEVANSSGVDQPGVIRVVGSSARLSETYVVTALDDDARESLVSNEVTISNILSNPGSSNVLGWTAIEGATRYRLYKKRDEAFGLLTETAGTSFTDDNLGADLEIQAPAFDLALETDFPGAIAHFQLRGWFGGTTDNTRGVWGGKTGTRATMSYHKRTPLPTDRIQLSPAVDERTIVRHIVPASHLWLMTSSAEIRLTGLNTDVLAPGEIDARPVSHVGCTGVRPIVSDGNILFVGERDKHLYELPSQAMQATPTDLSVRAADLFDGFDPQQSADQRAPVPIKWYVRDDGKLLGITYMPQQNIRAWHLHEVAGTDARVLSACIVPEANGDRLWAVIQRTINGSPAIYIERMARIETPASMTACKYLDSCVTYTGASTTSIPVPHLEGQVVYAIADGRVQGPFTVSGGVATLTTAATTAHVGLFYAPTFRPLPPSMMIDGFGKGVELNVAEAALRVDNSCGFHVKVYRDDDVQFGVVRTPWPAPGLVDTEMRSRDVSVPIEPGWSRNGQIEITQDKPLPLTIVSLTLLVDVGGPK